MALSAAPGSAWALSAACTAINSSFSGTYAIDGSGNGTSHTTGALDNGEVISVSWTGNTGHLNMQFIVSAAMGMLESPNSLYDQTATAGSGTVTPPNQTSGDYFVARVTPGPWATFAGSPDTSLYNTSVSITLSCSVPPPAPVVTGISPTSGTSAGGTSVTVTGTDFTGATDVRFAGVSASSVTVNSATSITATSPAGTGVAHVQVVTSGGISATSSADEFTYLAAPTVTAVSPDAGPTGGGTSVTLTGTGFTGATGVSFGATAGTGVTVNSASSITVTAPAGSAGTVNVRVTTPNGTSATASANQYTYVAAPTVTGVSPATGAAGGGTSVTITGTNLFTASAVSFGGVAATGFTVNSATSITATAPAGTGVVDIRVTNPGGTSATSGADQFTYVAAPTVTGVSPTSGPASGGTSVTVTGTGFTGATGVTFGGVAATGVTVNSATSITATSPAGSGTVDVRVTTPGGTSATSGADQFTYDLVAPTVTGISPTSGPATGGTSVTITGTDFTGGSGVAFGGVSATSITVNSATSITATSPAGTGTVDVRVTTAGGASATSGATQFTYTAAAPTVTALSTPRGIVTGGITIGLTGTDFTGATAVAFGATAATSFTVNSATSISVTVPAGTGTVNVRVTGPGGQSATAPANQFTYLVRPNVSAVTPTSGPTTGGTSVTLTGSGFTGASGVTFGGVAATGLIIDSDTQVRVTSPAGTAGVADVVLTASTVASSPTPSTQFTYSAPITTPTVTAVAPASGPQAGGTSVTVSGSGFTGATGVAFGGAAASFTVTSDTSITAVAPAGAGTVDIRVTTTGGVSATSAADRFTYAVAAPVVATFSPAYGATDGGQRITITGTGFQGASGVTFGERAAASFTVLNDTNIEATSPAGGGAVAVSVTTAGGRATSAGLFTYGQRPTVSVIVPTQGAGPVLAGATITIAGANFTGATAVTIGDRPAESFTVVSDTQITAVVPVGTGTTHVLITTQYGVSPGTNEATLTYLDASAPLTLNVPQPDVTLASGRQLNINVANAFSGSGQVTLTARQANGQPLPTWLRFNGATGTLTGSPPAGFTGKLTLEITARDTRGNTAQAVFTLTVTDKVDAGAAPVAGNVSFALAAASTTAVNLRSYVTGSYTALKITTAPTQGTASLDGDVLTYKSDSGASGAPDVFSYAATGPGGEASGRITVSRTSTPPPTLVSPPVVVVPPPVPTQPGVPPLPPVVVTIAPSQIFNEPVQDLDIVRPPQHGSLVLQYSTPNNRDRDIEAGVSAARDRAASAQAQADAEGVTILYTPNAGFVGDDSFTFVAIGENGRSAPVTLALKVLGPPPAATNLTAKTQAGRPVTVALPSAFADGPLTAAAVVSISPANAGKATIGDLVTAVGKGFSLTFTPQGSFSGTATVTYTLSNQYGPSAPATVTIAIDARPDPSADPEVNALADGQADLTRRFATAQIGNFAQRNEALHGDGAGDMAIRLAPGVADRMLGDRYAPQRGGPAAVDRNDPVERLFNRLTPEQEFNALAQGAEGAQTARKTGPREAGGVEGWAAGSITVGRREARDGAAKFDLSSSGLSAGADIRLSPGLSVGIGAGAGRDVAEVGAENSRIEGRSTAVAVYGSAQPTEGLFLDAVAGAGGLDYRLRRFVTATRATAEGQRDGDMTFGSLTGAIDRHSDALRWSAYGRLDYVKAELDGYVETGGGEGNLAFEARSLESLSGVVGGRLSFHREIGKDRILTPRLRLEVRHEFQDAHGETIRYADWLTGPSYLTSGRGWARDRLSVGGGLTLREAGSWKLDVEAGAEIAADELYGTLRAEGSVAF